MGLAVAFLAYLVTVRMAGTCLGPVLTVEAEVARPRSERLHLAEQIGLFGLNIAVHALVPGW